MTIAILQKLQERNRNKTQNQKQTNKPNPQQFY